jgi:hypothetical protein
MTPNQTHLSTEINSEKLHALVTELSRALAHEVEDNRGLRVGCETDCQEHSDETHLPAPLAAALPENVTRVVRWA